MALLTLVMALLVAGICVLAVRIHRQQQPMVLPQAAPAEKALVTAWTRREQLEDATSSETPTAVLVHAPWCTYCKRIWPHWQAAARASRGLRLRFATVDAKEAPELAASLKLKGFPACLMYRQGQERAEMLGYKSYDELMQWLKSLVPP